MPIEDSPSLPHGIAQVATATAVFVQKWGHTITVIVGFLTTGLGSIWMAWRRVRKMVRSAESDDASLKYSDLASVENRLTMRIDLLHQDMSQMREDMGHTRQILDTILLGEDHK